MDRRFWPSHSLAPRSQTQASGTTCFVPSRNKLLVHGMVAKRTFRKVHEFWSKWFGRVFGHFEGNFLVLSKMPEDLTIELPL